jgi:hypothetical protein
MRASYFPDGNQHRQSGRRRHVAVLLAAAFCLTGAAGGTRAGVGSPADTLTVFFTAETHGNLEPCACPRNPQGGLARRTGFLRRAAEVVRVRGGTTLVLDAGGFLPEGEVPLRDDPAVARRFTALLLDGLVRSGAQAIALDHGQRAFLQQTAPGEANRLRDVFLEADPPDVPRVLAWGTVRIALVALEETLSDDALRTAGSTARARGDLVIALARGDGFSGRRLARLSGADLVLLSRGARPEAPILEGSSILVGCGIEGREVGEVRLVLESGSGNQHPVPRVAGFRLHEMTAGTPADAKTAREVDALVRDAGPRAFVRNLE